VIVGGAGALSSEAGPADLALQHNPQVSGEQSSAAPEEQSYIASVEEAARERERRRPMPTPT
jgi:hypothetical protein